VVKVAGLVMPRTPWSTPLLAWSL